MIDPLNPIELLCLFKYYLTVLHCVLKSPTYWIFGALFKRALKTQLPL